MDEGDPYSPPATKLPISSRGEKHKVSAKYSVWISGRAKLVFGAYRRDDFADPELFLAQLGAVLEGYPENVISYVTSPQTGIQRRSKFPPTIAEIVAECDHEQERQIRIAELSKFRFERRERPFQPVEPNLKLRDGTMVFYDEYMRGEHRERSTWRRFTKAELEAIYQRNQEVGHVERNRQSVRAEAGEVGLGYDD